MSTLPSTAPTEQQPQSQASHTSQELQHGQPSRCASQALGGPTLSADAVSWSPAGPSPPAGTGTAVTAVTSEHAHSGAEARPSRANSGDSSNNNKGSGRRREGGKKGGADAQRRDSAGGEGKEGGSKGGSGSKGGGGKGKEGSKGGKEGLKGGKGGKGGGGGKGKKASKGDRGERGAQGALAMAFQDEGLFGLGSAGGAGRGRGAAAMRGGFPASNANHLLNFQYTSHDDSGTSPSDRGGAPSGPPARRSRPPARDSRAFNKALFLAANFRFLVLDTAPADPSLAHADRMLDWEEVVHVELFSPATQPLKCPICLDSPPTCPQMAMCGHVFCFPCLMRLMMMGEGLRCASPCPLCFQPLRVRELRHVLEALVLPPEPGAELELAQMVRGRESTVPVARGSKCVPCAVAAEKHGAAFPRSRAPHCARHARYTVLEDVTAAVQLPMGELTAAAVQMSEEGGEENAVQLPYVLQSMDELQRRQHLWSERRAEALHLPPPPPLDVDVLASAEGVSRQPSQAAASLAASAAAAAAAAPREDSILDVPLAWPELPGADPAPPPAAPAAPPQDDWTPPPDDSSRASGDAAEAPADAAAPADGDGSGGDDGFADDLLKELSEGAAAGPGAGPGGEEASRVHCFYQAADGQLVVVHPLTMRCLLAAAGGAVDALPPRLCAKVLEVEQLVCSEETRKRYRFLAHLPVTARIQLCELDLTGLVPPAALLPFQDEIDRRARRRARAEAADRAERRRAQAKDAAAALGPGPSAAELHSMPSLPSFRPAEEEEEEDAALEALGEQMPSAGVSFARVAQLGFASGSAAPELAVSPHSPGAFPSLSSSPSLPLGAWASLAGSSSPGRPGERFSADGGAEAAEPSSWLEGLDDALGALQGAPDPSPGPSDAGKGKKGKKAKNKGLLLFSTNQRGA